MSIVKTTASPVRGSRVWYFIQAVTEEIGSNATLPAFQTGGNTTLGGENIDEQTKQGRIIQKSTDEDNVDLEQYFVPEDPAIDIITKAKREGTSVKVWRVVVDKNSAEDGEDDDEKLYPAMFGYGIPDEIDFDDGGDDLVTLSYTLNIVGSLQDGMFPLTDEDIAVIDNLYDYQNPGETTGDYDDIQED